MDLQEINLNVSNECDVVVITSLHPSPSDMYRGAFVKTKVDLYRRLGKRVLVLMIDESVEALSEHHLPCGYQYCSVNSNRLVEMVASLQAPFFFAHSLSALTLAKLHSNGLIQKVMLWFHGFEVRDPRRLDYNFYDCDLRSNKQSNVALMTAVLGFCDRRDLLREIFLDPNVKKVFVSNYLKTIACQDVGAACVNSYVIPNPIDTDFFSPNSERDHRNILFLRPFVAHNYGLDLMQNVIAAFLKKNPDSKLQFFVCGDGKYHGRYTEMIKHLPNVKIIKKFFKRQEIKAMHAKCGTLLYTTRFDTQGVSMCEALSSGLQVIAHKVCAIPEFASDDWAFMVPQDSIDEMVSALQDIESMERSVFLDRAHKARASIKKTASVDVVIPKEFQVAG